jgi:uncharacterized protein
MNGNDCLADFFRAHPALAVALSGGVDSAYLAWAACAAGCRVRAYTIRSAFQPDFELADARAVADRLDVPLTVLDDDLLSDDNIARNGPDRCYHCKRRLFSHILAAALADGFETVADGTNASDDAADRPGMAALAELGVRSPLRECGITKAFLREGARLAGLPLYNKPAYACLATRIPAGTPIDAGCLRRIEAAETALFELGFRDIRVRLVNEHTAKIQVTANRMEALVRERGRVLARLSAYFRDILLDLDERKEST